MEELTQTILELPWPGLIPVGLLLLVGLLLWAAGRRVLRTGFGAAGLVLGGVLGWAAGGLDVVAAMNVPAWVFAAVAAVVAALIFAAAYRLVLAAAVAVLLAALAPLAVWTASEVGAVRLGGQEAVAQQPLLRGSPADEGGEPTNDLERWVEEVLGTGGDRSEPVIGEEETPAPPPEGDDDTGVWRAWWDSASEVLIELPRRVWTETAGPLRWTILAAAAVGGLLGLVLGAAAPAFSAAVVTALGGSMIMLASAWTLAAKVQLPQGPWVPTTPTAWLIWWLVLSVIGLGVQWTLRARRADKPAS
jgi:hypothetical protein